MGKIRDLKIGATYYFDNNRGTSEVCLKVLRRAGTQYECEYFDVEGNPVRKSSFNKSGTFCRDLRLHSARLHSARQMGKTAAFEYAYGMGGDEEAFQKHLDKQRLKIAETQGIDPKLLGVSREAMDDAISEKLDRNFQSLPRHNRQPIHQNCRCVLTTIEGDSMNKLIAKLNGLKGKEYDQPMYEEKKVVVSLHSILKESEVVKEADFGSDCVLTGLEVQGDKIVFSIREGNVEIEPEETKKD